MHASGKLFCIWCCILFFMSVLAGCGSSGSSHKHGVFVDSPAEGIAFRTESKSGVTDSYGRFDYEPGETVTFSIGGTVLGTLPAMPVITPLDLVEGSKDQADPAVTNITRLLMTLDEDSNPGNGILITGEVRNALKEISISFDQDPEFFAQDPQVKEVLYILNQLYSRDGETERFLCTEQAARGHLGETLLKLADAGYVHDSGSDEVDDGSGNDDSSGDGGDTDGGDSGGDGGDSDGGDSGGGGCG